MSVVKKIISAPDLKGFTLAEVLITLAIIGVVAAMTIPTLVVNYQKKVTLTKLQKAFNTISNAINLSSLENGNPVTWDWENPEDIIKEKIGKYIKASKYYGPDTTKTPLCPESGNATYGEGYTYGWLDNTYISSPFTTNNYSLITNDGVCIGTEKGWKRWNIFVDINSSINGPNMAGKDLFFFYIDEKTGILHAFGDELDDVQSPELMNACNKDAKYGGQTCAAKIIRDGWRIAEDYPW